MDSLDSELQPQIGRKVEESSNEKVAESPSPYSDDDFMVEAPADSGDPDLVLSISTADHSVGAVSSVRPTSLDLVGSGAAPSAV